MVDTVVEVVGLTKRFGSETAVDDVTFAVPSGSVVGFLGPNGAGKSTTLRMMLGLTAPSAGRVGILGRSYHELDDPVRTVGAVVDGVGFHPGRRGIEELRILAAAAGLPRTRPVEVLEQVGLAEAGRKRVGAYSLGMRQRLGLAAALLGDPRVLLLDEPANGLDPEGIRWVRDLLRWLADDGRAVLVSSHLLAEVSRLADEVIVIHRGRILTQGPVDRLTEQVESVVVSSDDDRRLGDVLERAGAEVAAHDDGLRVVGLEAVDVGRRAFEAGIVLHQLRRVEPDLESVFLELTGSAS